jgi:thiamine-phosphate pyrophosphorylase
MRVDYSSAVLHAFERAEALAAQEGIAEVQARHLLQGLLHEEEGKPCVLLANAGVDLPRVRMTEPAAAPARRVPISAAVQDILRQAFELGKLLSADRSVASEQILLALLQHDQEQRQWLESYGLVLARVEETVMAGQQATIPLEVPIDFDEPRGLMHTARILDACANRAREALRVLEDYARFALNDTLLTRELKTVRHDLADALNQLPGDLLLQSRDTPGDVGTTIATASEQDRADLIDVARANAKRIEESLRSLEEYGKIVSAEFGQSVEALRYRAYTLERAILLSTDARTRLAGACLYALVAEDHCRLSLAGTISEAAAGGAQIIQLREKGLADRALLEKARDVRRLTRKANVLFIVNDRPDIALLAGADGVHLGQDDLSVSEARRIVGPEPLIGVSTHNLEQVRQAVLDGASYIGVGPTFPSGTKSFAELSGLEFVRQALAETSLPAFVIGGVTVDNLPAVLEAGGRRVAVGQAIVQTDDPRAMASQFRLLLNRT